MYINDKTSVKFYTDRPIGAPTLGWQWGSLVKLLKAVLVDGYSSQEVSNMTFDSVNKLLTVVVPDPNVYEPNNILEISGHSEEKMNRQYRVVKISSNSVTLSCDTDLSPVSHQPCSIKVASMGWSLVYDNIESSGTACFKNNSDRMDCVLKVIDAKPMHYGDNWARFARVYVGTKVNMAGDFLGNAKIPFDPLVPNTENGNGVQGAGGIYGWYKWYYVTERHTSFSESMSIEGRKQYFPTSWYIVGDKETFYFGAKIYGKQYTNDPYSFCGAGVYDAHGLDADLFLIGSDSWLTASSNHNYSGVNPRNFFNMQRYDHSMGLTTYSAPSGGFWGNANRCTIFTINPDDNEYPQQGGLSTQDPMNGGFLISPIYVRTTVNSISTRVFRGRLRGIHCPIGFNGMTMFSTIGKYICLEQERSRPNTNPTESLDFLFDLEEW